MVSSFFRKPTPEKMGQELLEIVDNPNATPAQLRRAEKLVEDGADLTLRGKTGLTAQNIAAGFGFRGVIGKMCAREDFDPNQQDANRNTASMLAAHFRQNDILQDLKDRGASMDIRNADNKSTMVFASRFADTAAIARGAPAAPPETTPDSLAPVVVEARTTPPAPKR